MRTLLLPFNFNSPPFRRPSSLPRARFPSVFIGCLQQDARGE